MYMQLLEASKASRKQLNVVSIHVYFKEKAEQDVHVHCTQADGAYIHVYIRTMYIYVVYALYMSVHCTCI